ncbi:hypothetical protein [Tabrizicola flagellatus]|uniref:hypothetical protein n=1 Tax=Tabrizicola flagellatus TaxID=2593021 RepID=UPI0011F37181|nr:hypothetical protein [Tabrizicola flagellatus]
MWTFSLVKALVLWVRILPLLVVRLAAFGALGAGLAVAAIAGAWGAAAVGLADGGAGPVAGAVAGVVIAAVAMVLWRGRTLCLLRAMQIALLSDLQDRVRVPVGPGQVRFARVRVAARFGSAADLQALCRFVRNVTGLIPAVAEDGGALPALPAAGRVMQGGLVDQAVLTHAYRARPENAWEAAHDGLVLTTQNARDLLGTAARLNAAGWIATAALFLVLSQSLAGLAALWPGEGSAAAPVGAAMAALVLRAALVQPFLAACFLQTFRAIASGQAPLGEWRGRLTQVSEAFRTLGERAISWDPGGRNAA